MSTRAAGRRQGSGGRGVRVPERGSATIVAAAGMVIVLVMAMAVSDVVKVLVGVGRAQTAADAAALASAQDLAAGAGGDPEAAAAEYARRNGASFVECSCPDGGSEAVVEVRLRIGGLLLLGGDRIVTARARAVVDYVHVNEGFGQERQFPARR